MDDYISRAELLEEINLATWDTEGDKAEAHYIATQIEPAVKQNRAFIDEFTQQLKIDVYDFHIALSMKILLEAEHGEERRLMAASAASHELKRVLLSVLRDVNL